MQGSMGSDSEVSLKVAAQDDHSADAPALHLTLAAGMQPFHALEFGVKSCIETFQHCNNFRISVHFGFPSSGCVFDTVYNSQL